MPPPLADLAHLPPKWRDDGTHQWNEAWKIKPAKVAVGLMVDWCRKSGAAGLRKELLRHALRQVREREREREEREREEKRESAA